MTRRAAAFLLLAGLAGCGDDPLSVVHLPGEATPRAAATEDRGASGPAGHAPLDTLVRPDAVLEVVATGLEIPWDLEATPDGRLLVTERPGRIRVVDGSGLRAEPWATFDVHATDPAWGPETGLLGLALASDFETSGHVYVYGIFRASPFARSDGLVPRMLRRVVGALAPLRALRFEGRIYRLTDRDGRATDPVLVADGIPAFHYHAGGALELGPDGMLWLTTGDARLPAAAGDPGTLVGRVLRYRPDGAIPADNPDPRSPVWAGGFRNPQGLAWTDDGDLLAIEHGPSGFPDEGGRVGDDELDRVLPGRDYGWPSVAGHPPPQAPSEPPVHVWDPALAPAGLARISGAAFPAWEGDLLVTGLQRTGQLRRLRLAPAEGAPGLRVAEEEVLLSGGLGRLRLVAVGPDGGIYLGTSNRSVRGRAEEDDDRLFRVVRFLEGEGPDRSREEPPGPF